MAFLQKTYQDWGMARDTDVARGKDTLAYENFNIRITARDRETLLSVTNERGNVRVLIDRWLVLWNDPDGADRTQGFTIESAREYNRKLDEADDTTTEREDTELHLLGTVIGYNVLNNYVTLFTTEVDGGDHIYRIEYVPGDEYEWRGLELMSGDFGFDVRRPIETLGDYENDDVLKVYWLDGVNQPRVLNISDRNITENGLGDWTKMDFVAEFSPTLKVSVEKVYEGSAVFSAGVVQYVFTYGNKYGQQSNIVYVSPVYYASPSGRGGSPEENVNCQFRITMSGFDSTWQFVNVYRVMQTSESGQWTADRVAQVSVGDGEATYTDDGSSSESVDPAAMLYVGGREISAYTMCAKDQTLFLGNLKMLITESDPYIINVFAEHRGENVGLKDGISDLLSFRYADDDHCIPYSETSGYYPYACQLDYSGDVIRTFKAGEKYRIGMRFVTKAGTRTGVYWVGDVEQTLYPQIDLAKQRVDKACLKCDIPTGLVEALDGKGYVQAELMMAERTVSDRCVQAQGIVAPTVFNLDKRTNDTCFAYSSWYARPRLAERMTNRHYEPLPKNSGLGAEIQCIGEEVECYTSTTDESNKYTYMSYTIKVNQHITFVPFSINSWTAYVYLYGGYYETSATGEQELKWKNIGTLYKPGKTFTKKHNLRNKIVKTLKEAGFYYVDGKNIYNKIGMATGTLWIYDEESLPGHMQVFNPVFIDSGLVYADSHHKSFYVDENILTFHTPELTDGNECSYDNASLGLRIVGIAPVTSNITDYSVEVENFKDSKSEVLSYMLSTSCVSDHTDGLITFPLFFDPEIRCVRLNGNYEPYVYSGSDDPDEEKEYESVVKQTMMWLYPWHKTGSLDASAQTTTVDGIEVEGDAQNVLRAKTESNLRHCLTTDYIWGNGGSMWDMKGGEIGVVRVFNSDEETPLQIGTLFGKKIYMGNYDVLLSSRMKDSYDDVENEEVREFLEENMTDEGYMLYNSNDLSPFSSVESIRDSDEVTASDISIGAGKEEGQDSLYGPYKNVVYKKDTENLFYDPVDITSKCTPHIVISLDGEDGEDITRIRTLPDLMFSSGEYYDVGNVPEGDEYTKFYLPWAYTLNFNPDDYPDVKYYTLVYPSDYETTREFKCDDYDPDSGKITIYDTLSWLKGISWNSTEGYEDDSDTGWCDGEMSQVILYDDGKEVMALGVWEESAHRTKTCAPWNVEVESVIVYDASLLAVGLVFEICEECIDNVYVNGQAAGWATVFNRRSDGRYETTAHFPISGISDISVEIVMGTRTLDADWCDDSDETKYCTINVEDLPVSAIGRELDDGEYSVEWLTHGVENGKYAALDLKVERVDECFLMYSNYSVSVYYYFNNGEITDVTAKSFEYMRDVLYVPDDTEEKPYFFIAELYNDFSKSDERYGGTTDYAVRNNTFIPLGNVTPLDGASELTAYAGDTYFQRWDCQKTCKWSDEAENNINEFVSVMLETYRNIEGRYDVRRGLLNNQATTPENSNLFNGAYDNLGTLFSGNVLDDKYSLDEYPAQLTWTLDKTPGAETDPWTNVTLASVLDMDGSKGPLEALRTHANTIFAFQDRGIAEVLFNTRTQLATTEGVPVEIANSGRVDGKRYVTERNGCADKWSIGVTKGGLWFADGINGTINRVAQQVEDVSTQKGMSVWTRARCGTGIWDPADYGAFAAFADTTRDEVYFCRPTDGDRLDALCFSEVLGEFTSFYGYGRMSAMFNVADRLVAFRAYGEGESAMWLQGEGRYGELFGEAQDFYTQWRVAPDPYGDKTFTNLEYRADVFDMDGSNPYMEGEGRITGRTFDSLRVWDEYQGNEVKLSFDPLRDAYPDTRRLNRIWRTDIPRARRGEDNPFGLNRIRNPWVWLRLTGTTDTDGGNYMMNFHDLTVKYIE